MYKYLIFGFILEFLFTTAIYTTEIKRIDNQLIAQREAYADLIDQQSLQMRMIAKLSKEVRR